MMISQKIMFKTVFLTGLWILFVPLSCLTAQNDLKETDLPADSGKNEIKPLEVEQTEKVSDPKKNEGNPGSPQKTELPIDSGKNEIKPIEVKETAKVTDPPANEIESPQVEKTEKMRQAGKNELKYNKEEILEKVSKADIKQTEGGLIPLKEAVASDKLKREKSSLVKELDTDLIPDSKTSSKDKEISKVVKGKKDSSVPIIRTIEATAEKDGSYLFAGRILSDGGSTLLSAGIELSLGMKFQKTTKLPFALQEGQSNYQVKSKKLESGTRWFYRAYVRNSEEFNIGSVKKFKTTSLEDNEGWWNKGEDLGAGWRKSKWFGAFRKQAELNWVFHEKLGWAYVVSDQRDGLWLWQGETGWTWTQEGAWPCLWSNNSSSWLCFIGKIEGKPIFYDYETRKIRNLPKKVHKNEKFKVTVEKDDNKPEANKASDKLLVGSSTDPIKEIPKEKDEKNSKATDQVDTQKDALNEVTPLTSKTDSLPKTGSTKMIDSELGKTVDVLKSDRSQEIAEKIEPRQKPVEENTKTDRLPKTDSTKNVILVLEKTVEVTTSSSPKMVAEEITKTDRISKTDSSQKKKKEIIEIGPSKENSAKTGDLLQNDSEKIPTEASKTSFK
jgi:hypothetical protein